MHSLTIVELYILSNTVHVLTVSLSYRTMAVFIYADANVLMANSRRGRVCTSVGQSHAGIPGMALSWHSSSAPMTGAYSILHTPDPYFPVGQCRHKSEKPPSISMANGPG